MPGSGESDGVHVCDNVRGAAQFSPVGVEEDVVIVDTCQGFIHFLDSLQKRGLTNLSIVSRSKLVYIRRRMAQFIGVNIDEVPDQRGGAIPKRKPCTTNKTLGSKLKDEMCNSESIDSPISNSSSSFVSIDCVQSSSSDNDKSTVASSVSRSRKSKSAKKISISKLVQNLENRPVHRIATFNEEYGQDLEKYLIKFEDFCCNNFKDNKDFWIGELEGNLKGKTLETFVSLRDYTDGYDEVKLKLLESFRCYGAHQRVAPKNKFKTARLKSGEILFMFSKRLESLFKLAYPKHGVAYSTTLINQFVNAASRTVRELVRSKIMDLKLPKKRVSWDFVQRCVKIRDRENRFMKKNDVSGEDTGDNCKDIAINFSKDPNQHQGVGRYLGNSKHCDLAASRSHQQNYNGRTYYASRGDTRQLYSDSRGDNGWYVRPPALCNVCNRLGHLARDCRSKLNFLCVWCK